MYKLEELNNSKVTELKEIAKKLNQPISNIKVRVLRAKKILAEIISKP